MTQGVPEGPWSGGWWGLKGNEYKRIKTEVSEMTAFWIVMFTQTNLVTSLRLRLRYFDL